MNTKARIIASIGPASNDKEVLKEMLDAGMNVARINFSHGSYEKKAIVIKKLREIQEETSKNIAIIGDLQGPKLRLGDLPENGICVKKGDIIKFSPDEKKSGENCYFINYVDFAKDVSKDDLVLVDDGRIKLKVISSNKSDMVETEVIAGGTLLSRKGVNLPDTKLSLPAITEKDKEDVIFALENKLDWIALSFVRKKEDIIELRNYISEFYGKAKIIAKIEKPEAVEDIDGIIEVSDGIMVARGDLGVEVDFKKVPVIQKIIIKKCINMAKPVIIATQMLDSMIKNFRPTRAEANDVANAVMDMADGLMLSGETAIGDYPVESIISMQSIIQHTENYGVEFNRNHPPQEVNDMFIPDSVCYNAFKMAQQTGAKAIIPFTYSGNTALRISSHRPSAAIYAFTGNEKLLKRLPLVWGVEAFYFPIFNNIDKAVDYSLNILLEKELIKKGDIVIHVGSSPLTAKSRTNMIKLSIV